jgi:hypothetical protein
MDEILRLSDAGRIGQPGRCGAEFAEAIDRVRALKRQRGIRMTAVENPPGARE